MLLHHRVPGPALHMVLANYQAFSLLQFQLPGSSGRGMGNIAGWLTQPDVTARSAQQSRLVFVAAATRMPAELSRVNKQ